MPTGEIFLQKNAGWAEIRFNRPEVNNALNTEIVEQLESLIGEVETDGSIRSLLFSGEGEKSFIAGADIKQLETMNPASAKYLIDVGHRVFNKIENLPIPTVAAVNGYCLGGGLELALCCDIRICSRNARFALPEIMLGVIPGWGGTVRLPLMIGEGRAKNMILRGKRLDADEALACGLVTDVFETVETLREEAEKLASEMSQMATITMALDKALIKRWRATDALCTDDALALAYTFTTEDTKEGIRAFVEKRKPIMKGK